MSDEPKHHNQTINLLRIVAIIGVIGIHTTTRLLESVNFDFSQEPLAILFNQLLRFAVPLFFMISGYVLELNHRNSEKYFDYLKRRIEKIIGPYLIWSAIYYYFVYTNHTIGYWQSLIGGNASYQLYFIPSLLIFYIGYPVIHKYIKLVENKRSLLALGLIQFYFLYQDYWIRPSTLPYPMAIVSLNFFVFIVGMVICRNEQILDKLVNKWIFVLTTATILTGGYVVYEGVDNFWKTGNYLMFYSQWRISILIYTILLYGCGSYFLAKISKGAGLIKIVSTWSMNVFFAHVLVLEIVWKFFPKEWLFILTTVLSFGLAGLISQIWINLKKLWEK